MSQIPRSVRRFIDIEAGVDGGNDSESGSEQWDAENFIDDGVHSLDQSVSPHHVSWRDLPDRQEGLSELLTRILERSRSAAQPRPATDDNSASISYTATVVGQVARSPGLHDYPLWRVRCRLGMEQEIVFFLLQTAVPHHQLRSAFMRNSIRGWVYLETTMNEDLIRHLRLSPGVVHRNAGIIREQIDFADWTKVLSQHDSDTNSNLAVGDWVWVRKGTYKGDVGYVAAIENWGGVSLLLVPRLPGPRHPGSSLSKRKRSTPPELNLFDPLAAKCNYGIDPVQQGPRTYRFNGYTFEYGLIFKAFDLRSVSSTSVQIPMQLLFLYRHANHPALATTTFPRPLEWHFAEGEVVWDRHSLQKCVIKVVGDTSAEVDFRIKEGTKHIDLSDLLKEFHPGEFVEVMGGPFRGQSGWVEGGWYNVVHIAVESSSDDGTEIRDIKSIEVHVNCLKAATPPFSHAQSSPGSEKRLWNDPIPWIGTTILVSKPGHPMKGYQGIIKTVLCKQPTKSGLSVVVQLAHLDPSCPYQTVVLNYDDVIEAKFRCKLFDFKKPQSILFVPLDQDHLDTQTLQSSAPSSSGNLTPMPDWHPSSTPAWNPSSQTPMPMPSTPSWNPLPSWRTSPDPTPAPAVSSSSSRPAPPQHPLLDSQLLGVQLKVIVNGGHFKDKETAVSLELVAGQPSIRRTSYKTSDSLDPSWVSPKHPNPTRDNGLLVVIKAEHCGKYVRRIHHRFDQETAIIILGVVKRTENAADSLTGEQLELSADHLCVAVETKEDKKHNELVMTALRKQAQKIRAK